MSRGRTTIPEWELTMLRSIAEGRYPAARYGALERYIAEREKRRRYARVRDERDRTRRTLVGTHVPLEKAEFIRFIAAQEGTSVTQFVNLALRQAIERSDTYRGR